MQECRDALLRTGTAEPFALAQKDISDRFQIPQKLYGREHETDTLLSAFEQVASGKTEIMLVAGYSGIGKLALVKEIYKSLTEKQGYFISGKFDQFHRNIPYSALVNAFKELVRQLLTENEEQLSVWKEKLLTALGPNGQVITDVIPEIGLIIGDQPAVPQLGPAESQNRFNLVFRSFMRVFCQPEHPLIIFWDDLQWADSATLRLLELVMTDRENTALLLIGAYKSAVANAMQAEQYRQSMSTLMPVAQYPFYCSLALLAQYSMATRCEQAEYMEKIAVNQQKMALWAENAPMTYQHKHDLVEAEKACISGQNWKAVELYEKAIAGAKENEYLHEEALACELLKGFPKIFS